MSEKQPDWDKITEGKIRHGIAVEAFSNGMELNADNMKTIEKWVQFVIHGYDGIKEIVDNHNPESKPLTEQEAVDSVKEKFDGEEIDTDKYIADQIEKAVVGLDRKNKNIVMARLRDGKISTENLEACLSRIEDLKKG
jgi:hypothetical protein|tara:strand:+ start:3320 stop:3733 length:414 start_codon:yes stop_codon:yes gene_type:complete